jgi:phage terminase small subunit
LKTGRKPADDRREIFVREYVTHFNATKAAIAAGYAENSARVTASQLLADPNIQAACQKLLHDRTEKLDITGERIIAEIAKLAFANIGDYIEWSNGGWKWKDSKSLTRDQMAAIHEVAETVTQAGGTTKIKMYDKRAALELLGRWKEIGLWKDSVEVDRGPKSTEAADRVFGEVRGLMNQLMGERKK